MKTARIDGDPGLSGELFMPSHSETTASDVEPFFVADHPVLDLLNTVAFVDGETVDLLRTDADVVRWLERAGMASGAKPQKFPASALLSAARRLRETIRPLVLKRKDGQAADPGALNGFLREAGSYPQLVWERGSAPMVERRREARSPEQILGSVAESAAEFLATADFSLVRPCEGRDCILWFYDRTKSHRRRWCSMAVCGNRHKVEAFRERKRG
jgi:predicted RNA-binding Zn ribbon-like protein